MGYVDFISRFEVVLTSTNFSEIIKEFNYCWGALKMSEWMKDCFAGNLGNIEVHLERDPSLLDRRESPLLMNGLMYAIHGFKLRPTQQHPSCIAYLVERGTPVNSKDLAGFTPLYQLVSGCCWGVVGGDSKLTKIANFLLEQGADMNKKNRLGNTPIFSATTQDTDFLEWLLENGADPGATNNEGVIFHDHAMVTEHHNRVMSAHMTELCREKREEAIRKAAIRSCNVCSKQTLKRCSGCFLVYYCGKECQKAGWNDHKEECKETRREYATFELRPSQYRLITPLDVGGVGVLPWVYYKPSGRSHFVVKIQAPWKPHTEHKVEKDKDRTMLVHNEERTIFGFITPEMDHYEEVMDAIRKRGILGVRAFFYAFWEDGFGLRINVKRMQPPETW